MHRASFFDMEISFKVTGSFDCKEFIDRILLEALGLETIGLSIAIVMNHHVK